MEHANDTNYLELFAIEHASELAMKEVASETNTYLGHTSLYLVDKISFAIEE